MRPFAKAAISANTIAPAVAGGPDVYYYTNTWSSGVLGNAIHAAWQPQNYAYGGPIVVGQSGTATILSMRASHASTPINCKIAIYNSALDLVANGSGATSTSSGNGAWVDIAVNAAVASGTYHIFGSMQTGDGWWHVNTGQSGGLGWASGYASFPPATEGSTGAEDMFGGRIYVD